MQDPAVADVLARVAAMEKMGTSDSKPRLGQIRQTDTLNRNDPPKSKDPAVNEILARAAAMQEKSASFCQGSRSLNSKRASSDASVADVLARAAEMQSRVGSMKGSITGQGATAPTCPAAQAPRPPAAPAPWGGSSVASAWRHTRRACAGVLDSELGDSSVSEGRCAFGGVKGGGGVGTGCRCRRVVSSGTRVSGGECVWLRRPAKMMGGGGGRE